MGPVQPSDKRFLTVKGSRVDRHSSIIRLFPEDLGKCLTGEGRRGRVLRLGKYLFDGQMFCMAVLPLLCVFFYFFIHIIFFTIIVYILTLVLSARTGIHCIYDNGSLSDIQFTSWNVRGLNKTVKLKQMLNRIRQMKAKIAFFQETHLVPEDVVMVRKRWPGQVFSASFNSHSRGFLYLYIIIYLYK